jgi:hypothetical protein
MPADPRNVAHIVCCSALAALLHSHHAAAAVESIEFVGEHLAEIAMDNRYATLPLWSESDSRWSMSTQAALAQTRSGGLSIDGPMFALGVSRRISGNWELTGFAFFDNLRLSADLDQRPMEAQFATGVPLALPAEAEFTGLSGTARGTGMGFAFKRSAELRLWHAYDVTAGVLWHRVELRDYSFDFRILDGPDAGATGLLDYSATYTHTVPFFGIAWPREHGNWGFTPHVQAAIPLPRRGVVGHITGPGYDLRGDTGQTGVGTPFGDPSVTIGFDVAYRPWNLTIDLGALATQALLEPLIHEGIERNWLLSFSWTY